jgi:hypothetical protein
MVTGRTPHL